MATRLPLWRTVVGLAIPALLVAVLVALAPAYVENYQLAQYVHSLATSSAAKTQPDDTLRSKVVMRAHTLHLPVVPGDVRVTHTGGMLQLNAAYHVQMNLSLYRVDLHMSAH